MMQSEKKDKKLIPKRHPKNILRKYVLGSSNAFSLNILKHLRFVLLDV